MIGRRYPDGDMPEEAGGYSKLAISQPDGSTVTAWAIMVPTGGAICIIGRPNSDGSPYHWVRENEEGSITVEPNPPDAPEERRNSNSIAWNGWHGYIHDGVWRKA